MLIRPDGSLAFASAAAQALLEAGGEHGPARLPTELRAALAPPAADGGSRLAPVVSVAVVMAEEGDCQLVRLGPAPAQPGGRIPQGGPGEQAGRAVDERERALVHDLGGALNAMVLQIDLLRHGLEEAAAPGGHAQRSPTQLERLDALQRELQRACGFLEALRALPQAARAREG